MFNNKKYETFKDRLKLYSNSQKPMKIFLKNWDGPIIGKIVKLTDEYIEVADNKTVIMIKLNDIGLISLELSEAII